MNPIIAPIRPGDQGAEVANLQSALIALLEHELIQVAADRQDGLLRALGAELGGQVYREATKEAVERFQAQRGLAGNGKVDEATAAALNAALRVIGALGGESVPGVQPLVAGVVVERDRTPFKGFVILFQEADRGSIPLGERTTDPEGRYAITYSLPAGMQGTTLRVAAFDADGQRRAEAVFRPASAVEVVDLEVRIEGMAYRVSGKLTSDTRAGVGGLRVVIVDKNVGGDTNVAEATTNPDGGYRLAFNYSGTKQRPDLQARAFHRDLLLGASDVRYNASNVETLDVSVQGSANAVLAAEHETLTSDLARHFTGQLRELRETIDQQDITYLANKSGWDARAVALASLADQFSARTADAAGVPAIDPALFYTLFRAGIPANAAAVYRTPAADVEALWKSGIEQGVAPAHLEAGLAVALDQFRTLSARQALDGPAVAGRSSIGELLAVSLPDADVAQREQFARLKLQHQGDPTRFWDAVTASFGEPAARQLRVDGQLAYLTLNNAPLIGRIRAATLEDPLTAPVDLIARGFHRADRWQALIDEGTVPPEVPGDAESARRARYAEVLATQLRLSYPTATVAAMVKSGETPTAAAAADKVHDFLLRHHDRFQIGTQTIEQFVARNQIPIEPEVQQEITRIQRVRQITPSDAAMNALLKQGVDSAYAVVRYDRDEFVAAFKDAVGGETQAVLIHAKAQQVHGAVLSIAISYLVASNAPGIGVHSPAQIVNPVPRVPDNVGDVIAYASLEKLLGEMDYCECQHCRSILSPAAYLVDLLQFLDRDATRWTQFRNQWRAAHDNVPYPHVFARQQDWIDAGRPEETVLTPLEVLLSRRPDLQHLPLTCENTNTPLPYIDLVNETLEHFVVNGLTLQDYRGHTTDDHATPEELLANPQFVQDAAYGILAGTGNPAPLLPPTPLSPFHQPLERVRRLFDAFEAPLQRVMEVLRKDDSLERASDVDYGWRDIRMEELRLSRAEYALLTDRTLTLQRLYGFPPATPDADVLAALSNAKAFTRRLEISYIDLIDIIRTRFVNPHGASIPKLERLGVSLETIKDFKNGALTEQDFEKALAPHVDPAPYGGDIKAWVTNQANYDMVMSLLVLADPTGANNAGSFARLELRYADPARLADRVRPFELVRLLRFIRLWKKLGWSIEDTDKAITALYPSDQSPDDPDDAVNLQRLDAGFLVLLPRLGVLQRVIDRLQLKVKTDLLPLLACFAPMDTYGAVSLYRRLFANPSLLKQDPAFADDGFGTVLDGSTKVLAHPEALRGALALSGDEFARICEAVGQDANTPLTVDSVSQIFRRGWLARKLELSVQELLLLARYSGIDPFAVIDPVAPPILAFIELVHRLRATSLKPSQALYLIWNQDISGTSAPGAGQINEFARSLRADLAAADRELAIADDPDGQVARARMALVYDSPTTDLFFGLLNNTLVTDVPYSHDQPALQQPILDIAPGRLAYDDFRKRLSFAGVMTAASRDALEALGGVPDALKLAIQGLYAENQRLVAPFFARYPELQPLYDAYVASNAPVETKRSALLESFLPTLKARRKHQQAVQAISSAAKTDAAFAEMMLGDAAVLHAAAGKTRPALEDLTVLEKPGLSAQFFFRGTATGNIDQASDVEPALDYRPTGPTKLPSNGGNPLSGIWSGYLEATASAFYNIRIDSDAGASVTLAIGGVDVRLTRSGNAWKNATPIELRAGTLEAFTLKVEKVQDILRVSWQSSGRGWEVIPASCLLSASLRDRLDQAYTRFFKAVSLAAALELTADEMAYLGSHTDYRLGDEGWLNHLAVAGSPDAPTARALSKALDALLIFSRMKAALSPDDSRLLRVMKEPAPSTKRPDGAIFALTRWEPGSLDAMLARFDKSSADLASLETLQRLFEAFDRLAAPGISATAMISAATNEPTAIVARDLQAALRARYAESDWLAVIKPINDDLRVRQRDALVAWILHQMRSSPSSEHIDTPEKLFEYFLMDVQIAPCMETSRIRHALSSVQLFIERSLMNLEPRVAPSALNAGHWEWMRRYRVWEANRKVFLWPENWLEPELRDDQSPFFKELMSELLQGDITEDRAATALTGYLSKLAEVAKLEPCGVHLVENDPYRLQDDVVHVVARSPGAGRKYYYRKREDGSWTPWEQIKLDIEDNPVVPVVWKGRLFLFWLRLLKQPDAQGAQTIDPTTDRTLAALKPGDIKKDPPKTTLQALLCWSEYFNKQWTPVRTSDVDRPTTLSTSSVVGPFAFDRSRLVLETAEEGDALRIKIGGASGSFLLHTTHGLPVREEEAGPPAYVQRAGRFIVPFTERLTYSPGMLVLDYDAGTGSSDDNVLRNVLSYKNGGRTMRPFHELQNPWNAPFFFEDRRHVFYVASEQTTVQLDQWNEYGVVPDVVVPDAPSLKLPQLYREKHGRLPDLLGPVITEPRIRLTDPGPLERFVTEDAHIKRVLGVASAVQFGDALIGPAGRVKLQGERP